MNLQRARTAVPPRIAALAGSAAFPRTAAHPRSAAAPRTAALVAFAIVTVVLLTAVPAALAASGQLAWHREVVGPSSGAAYEAAASAPRGGVYAAGYIFNATGDFLTTRYAPAGGRAWLRSLDFSQHIYDAVQGMTTDRKGDVIVAGQVDYPSLSQSEAIAKYGPGGHLQWVRYYHDSIAGEGNVLATDARGNIYVTTRTASGDIALLKYSPSGTRRWLRIYVGPGGNDQPRGIATDAAGNVYVTGSSFSSVTNNDIVTLKYTPSGHRAWLRRYDGQASSDDDGLGVAVAPTGAVYVAGLTTGVTTGQDAIVLKYSSGGTRSWTRTFSSTGVFDDEFEAIALLRNGDVAATGFITSAGATYDVLTVRLSPAGHVRWQRSYNGPDNLNDLGAFIAGSASGAVYVAGQSDGATTSTDILTLKYNAAGHRNWARRYSSAGAVADFPGGLVVNAGGVYVAGQEDTTPGAAVLLKYTP